MKRTTGCGSLRHYRLHGMIRMVFVTLLAFGNIILVANCQSQSDEENVELTASSPFQMVLGPIASRLDLADLQVVEDSMATVLLSLVSSPEDYLNLEGVIQESDFLESQSSQIRFFVLATTRTEAETQRVDVNALIQDSLFGTALGRDTFLQALRQGNRTKLAQVSSVKAAPLAPATNPSNNNNNDKDDNGSSSGLSNLDIILIAVSGLIFLGIAYMIIQHHKDRGYFENQRVLAANQPQPQQHTGMAMSASHSHNELDDASAIRSIHWAASKIRTGGSHETPSTPSTIHSNERTPTPPADKRTQSPREPNLPPTSVRTGDNNNDEGGLLGTNTATTTPRIGTSLTYVAADGESTRSLAASSLDDWVASTSTSRTAKRDNKTRPRPNRRKMSDDGNVSEGAMIGEARDTLSLSGSSGDESEDVFFVDVENASVRQYSSNRSQTSSSVAEWMKTIRVVRTPSPLIVGEDVVPPSLMVSNVGDKPSMTASSRTVSSARTNGPGSSMTSALARATQNKENYDTTDSHGNMAPTMAITRDPETTSHQSSNYDEPEAPFVDVTQRHAPSTPPPKPSPLKKAAARVEV